MTRVALAALLCTAAAAPVHAAATCTGPASVSAITTPAAAVKATFVDVARRDIPPMLEVRLLTPDGHLYTSITVPVALAGDPSKVRTIDGHPFPVAVAPVKAQKGGGYIVTLPPVEVAGAAAGLARITGQWQVEVRTPEGEAVCTRLLDFRP